MTELVSGFLTGLWDPVMVWWGALAHDEDAEERPPEDQTLFAIGRVAGVAASVGCMLWLAIRFLDLGRLVP